MKRWHENSTYYNKNEIVNQPTLVYPYGTIILIKRSFICKQKYALLEKR